MIEIKTKSKGVLEIDCSSEFEHLDRIVDESEAFLSTLLDDDDLAYKVVLLLTEAVTNAIEHGNKLDTTKAVHILLEVKDAKIVVEVQDEGHGFNPNNIANPIDTENILNDGGRGIFFIEQMADEVHFDNNGSRVQIVFNR